jgi:hypothetical protein
LLPLSERREGGGEEGEEREREREKERGREAEFQEVLTVPRKLRKALGSAVRPGAIKREVGPISPAQWTMGEDRQLQDACAQDAEGTMREAGLSDDSIETLLSRDLAKTKAALEKELPGRDFILFMIIF